MNKEKKHLVSIILPAHNAEKYLYRSVTSLDRQTYDQIQIVIVVNASTDNTYEIAHEMAQNNNKITLINTKQAGVSNARNLGLSIAKGDIIGFCDADDYYSEDIIEKIVASLSGNKYGVAICGFEDVTETKECVGKRLLGQNEEWNSERSVINVLTQNKIMGSVWNKFFKREFIQDVKFNTKLTMCEDTHFVVSIFKKHPQVKTIYINQVGYNYVNNPNSVTNDLKKVFDGNELRYIQSLEQIESDFHLSRKEKRNLNAAKAGLAYGALQMLKKNRDIQTEVQEKRKKKMKQIFCCHYIDYWMCGNISIKQKIRTSITSLKLLL